MDYSIAFIIPNRTVSETVSKLLKEMNFEYPVVTESASRAVAVARELLPKGLRLVVSHGITYEYLKREIPVVMSTLPFSGLDTLIAIRKALSLSDRVVHMGTPPFFHLIQRSLEYLGEDPDRISLCNLQMEDTIEEQTQMMIDQGYEVIMGGQAPVRYARSKGKVGIECGVDELVARSAILNAREQVKNIFKQEQQYEQQKAILQASSDALIAIDQDRNIVEFNIAAQRLIGNVSELLVGKSLDEILKSGHFKNVNEIERYSEELNVVPVVLNEVPVVVHGTQQGSVITIKKVAEIQELEYQLRKDLVLKGLVAKNYFSDIVGVSPEIQQAKKLAAVFAKYESTVLIFGETGTGKELFAQSIHNASRRRSQPFVAINCATLPEGLIESELFGYVKGAFTGASQNGKQGLFEIADKGTIFLDEISELPLSTQSKLLRVLQDGDIIRVGGDKIIHIDVRIICSSNKDLLQMVKEKKFKDDLYYRLCVLEIDIPPLRKRPADIQVLSHFLVEKLASKHHKNIQGISERVLRELSRLPFGGNVRELKNLLERMVILSDGDWITMEDFYQCVRPAPQPPHESEAVWANESINLYDAQKKLILEALRRSNKNKAMAAAMLGIDPSTLWRKMKTYGLS